MKKEIVIVGAGPAGLTAAYELLKESKEYSVVIVEESGTIGGISRTVNHNGNRMDIGGHRFFSKNEKVMEWWTKMMPLQGELSYDDKVLGRNGVLVSGGPNPEKENRVMLQRQRISRIYYKRKFFDYPISLKPQTFIILNKYLRFIFYALFNSNLNLSAIIAINSEFVGFPFNAFTV